MNLYVLRHASAGTRRMNPLLDLKRPLDKDGKRHTLQLANLLQAMNLQFDLIVSSPLKRSLQTAQLVATETGYEAKILNSNALAPTANVVQFRRLLKECAPYENVLVVGHNPNLTTFLASLLFPATTVEPPPVGTRPPVRLRKGSLARLSYERGPATLQWLLDPRTVRSLYITTTKGSRSAKGSRRKTLRKTSRK